VKSFELVSAEVELSELVNGVEALEQLVGVDEHAVAVEVVRAQVQFLKGPEEVQTRWQGAQVVACDLQHFESRQVRELDQVARGDLVVTQFERAQSLKGSTLNGYKVEVVVLQV
jgi:hypothetical protein